MEKENKTPTNSEKTYKELFNKNNLIKIDNKISRPTDFQQKCRLSVGFAVPKLNPTSPVGNIRLSFRPGVTVTGH